MKDLICVECELNEMPEIKSNSCDHCRTTVRDNGDKKSLLNRCSRAEGQIRGIKKMIVEDVYCDDILNQISATQSALNALSRILLEQHMRTCLVDRIKKNDSTVINEIMITLNKMMK